MVRISGGIDEAVGADSAGDGPATSASASVVDCAALSSILAVEEMPSAFASPITLPASAASVVLIAGLLVSPPSIWLL